MKKILCIAILAGAAYFGYKKFVAKQLALGRSTISLSNEKPAVSHMRHMRDGGFSCMPNFLSFKRVDSGLRDYETDCPVARP